MPKINGDQGDTMNFGESSKFFKTGENFQNMDINKSPEGKINIENKELNQKSPIDQEEIKIEIVENKSQND